MIKVDLTENFGIKLSISGKKVVVLNLKLTVLTIIYQQGNTHRYIFINYYKLFSLKTSQTTYVKSNI